MVNGDDIRLSLNLRPQDVIEQYRIRFASIREMALSGEKEALRRIVELASNLPC